MPSLDRLAPPERNGVVRVFVSSTFLDMQADRDELAKRVFPKLRKLCESRGLVWSDVDLRWGLTDEERARGEILPLCLAQIDRSRPFFVGLLGERYGWVPDVIPSDIQERQPWLAEHRQASVTELEILHGALNTPSRAEYAFFYFRDPAYVERFPAQERAHYVEAPTIDEIVAHGDVEAARHALRRREYVAALKDRIRSSGLPVRENYIDPRDLGDLVLRDLTGAIDRLYPEAVPVDPVSREGFQQEAFLERQSQFYIQPQGYFAHLDRHVRGSGPPLVVMGESGVGKTALLASWARHFRAIQPGAVVVFHSVGATTASADRDLLVRRIIRELSDRFHSAQDVSLGNDRFELQMALMRVLNDVGSRGRFVLVLDALDRLEDRDGALALTWLPSALPEGARVIIAVSRGPTQVVTERRGWPVFSLGLLDDDERGRLVVDYLAFYGKALDEPTMRRVTSTVQSRNHLFLRILLEELRLHGDHESLGRLVEACLTATGVRGLYATILERFERDYEEGRPGLVRRAMSMLWVAHRGLTEVELLDLLGEPGEPLPQAFWSPLFLASGHSLMMRSGLICFAHPHFRRAVQERYVPTEELRREAHLELARYFSGQPIGARQIEELPWQLAQAGDWVRLVAILERPAFLERAWEIDPLAVRRHWAAIEAHSEFRMVDTYQAILQVPERDVDHAARVGALAGAMGYRGQALSIWQRLANVRGAATDRAGLATVLRNQATILRDQGQVDEALRLVIDAQLISEQLEDVVGRASCLGLRGSILRRIGLLDEALACHKDQERLASAEGIPTLLSDSLNGQAQILAERGNLHGALELFCQVERIFSELGDTVGLQLSIENQAITLGLQGHLEQALALLAKHEQFCRELGDGSALCRCLFNQALLLLRDGARQEAITKLLEANSVAIGRSLVDMQHRIRAVLNDVDDDVP